MQATKIIIEYTCNLELPTETCRNDNSGICLRKVRNPMLKIATQLVLPRYRSWLKNLGHEYF